MFLETLTCLRVDLTPYPSWPEIEDLCVGTYTEQLRVGSGVGVTHRFSLTIQRDCLPPEEEPAIALREFDTADRDRLEELLYVMPARGSVGGGSETSWTGTASEHSEALR